MACDLDTSRSARMAGRAAIALLLLLGAAATTQAQPPGPNLLQNPGFDTDLSGWTHDPSVVWRPDDSGGVAGSGSAYLLSTQPNLAPEVTQCLPVSPGTRYRLGTMLKWLDGTVDLEILFHPQANCQGPISLPLHFAGPTRRTVWRPVSVAALAPEWAVSAMVRVRGVLAIWPSVDAFVDEVYFRVEGSTRFFTMTPCRIIDTRGGSPMTTGADRVFALADLGCAVPATARAVSVNLTVVSADAAGHLGYYTAGPPPSFFPPTYSSLNFGPGETRATNAVIDLNDAAEFALYVALAPPLALVDVVVDVNGYFQ